MPNSAPSSKILMKTNQKDFETSYDRCCALNGTYPLRSVKAFVENGIVDINGDKLEFEDWKALCEALSLPHQLKFIAIRSFWKQKSAGKTNDDDKKRPEKSPSIQLPVIIHNVAKCLKASLMNSSCLTCLELQGIPWTLSDVELISEGLSQNHTVQHLSFDGCLIGDGGLKVVIRSIISKFNITSVNFSHCGLTAASCKDLVSLVKHQTIYRHSVAWKETLRQDIVNLDNMGGLQRLTLNGNSLIGDKGAHILADSLNDNIWLKAIDIQECGIQDSGARAFLNSLKYNTTLYILDIRRNCITNRDLLLRISQQLHFNTQGQTSQFKWLNRTESSKLNSTCRKTASRRKHGIPWRLAARFNSARHFHSHVPGVANVFNQSQPSLLEYSSDNKSDTLSNSNRRKIKTVKNNASGNNAALLDAIKVELSELRTRLLAEIAAKKLAENKISELALENENLKKCLEKKSTATLDDMTLNAIENVFLKFNNFLQLVQEVGDSSHSLDKLKASMSSVKDSAVASKKTDNGNISKGYSRSLMENHQIISPKDSTTVESSSTSNEPQEPTIAHTPSPLSRNNDSSSRSEKVPSKRNVGNMEMSGSHKGSRSFAHPSSISLKQVPDVHSKSAENSSKDQQNTSYLNINTSPLNLRPHSIMKQRSESGGQKSRLTKSVDGTSSSISTHFSDSSLTGSLDGILIASDKF